MSLREERPDVASATMKQALLQRIARENPGLSWHHFGDLDPDGLAIAGHLIRKTGLPFQLCAMGVQ